jgi:hypothetical protein
MFGILGGREMRSGLGSRVGVFMMMRLLGRRVMRRVRVRVKVREEVEAGVRRRGRRVWNREEVRVEMLMLMLYERKGILSTTEELANVPNEDQPQIVDAVQARAQASTSAPPISTPQ